MFVLAILLTVLLLRINHEYQEYTAKCHTVLLRRGAVHYRPLSLQIDVDVFCMLWCVSGCQATSAVQTPPHFLNITVFLSTDFCIWSNTSSAIPRQSRRLARSKHYSRKLGVRENAIANTHQYTIKLTVSLLHTEKTCTSVIKKYHQNDNLHAIKLILDGRTTL
jgi:hypothetical protein